MDIIKDGRTAMGENNGCRLSNLLGAATTTAANYCAVIIAGTMLCQVMPYFRGCKTFFASATDG